MYDRILVPTDGSAGSERVAAHAAELAAETGADLHALFVVDESASDVGVSDGATATVREGGEEALAAVADVAREHGVDAETELREDVPAEAIADYADEVGADLLVMGTHGRQGLQRYVLGSVTEHVLREADQPVLAVKLDTVTVTDEAEAERVAREALAEEGADLAELREEPYRQRSTWVVPAVTAAGDRVNVHVDAVSGDARVAHVD